MEIKHCKWVECNGTFQPKNYRHSFCSNKCRKKHNRAKKGQPLIPAFIKGKKSPTMEAYRPRIQEYRNEMRMVRTGTSFRWGLAAVGAGYSLTGRLSLIETICLSGLGYILGKGIDDINGVKIVPRLVPIPVVPRSKSNTIFNKSVTDKPKSKEARIMTGIQYRDAKINSIGLAGKYNYLMGDPADGFCMLVTGRPGNGKSTWATEFAQYFKENHGNVLYLASEQSGLNKPLQELFKRFSVTFDINTKPTSKVSDIIKDAKNYKMIVIDSVNNLRLTPDDINKIRKELPTTSIVMIMQSTKDGDFKGDQRFFHDCDIRIDLKRPKVFQTKSRYAPPAEDYVFKN